MNCTIWKQDFIFFRGVLFGTSLLLLDTILIMNLHLSDALKENRTMWKNHFHEWKAFSLGSLVLSFLDRIYSTISWLVEEEVWIGGWEAKSTWRGLSTEGPIVLCSALLCSALLGDCALQTVGTKTLSHDTWQPFGILHLVTWAGGISAYMWAKTWTGEREGRRSLSRREEPTVPLPAKAVYSGVVGGDYQRSLILG